MQLWPLFCLCVHKINPLLNLLLQLREHLIKPFLLVRTELPVREDLLHAALAEFARTRKERRLGQFALHVCALHHTLLSPEGLEDILGEEVPSICHGQRGRSRPGLGLYHLVTAELNAVGEGGQVVLREVGPGHLRQEGKDGDTRVSANDCDILGGGVHSLVGRHEAVGPDNVQGGYATELGLVVDARLFEDLGGDGDSGVHRVGNDGENCLGAEFGASLHERFDDGGIGVEEVVAGHARFAGHAGRDDDNVSSSERLAKPLVGPRGPSTLRGECSRSGRISGDVAQIGRDTRRTHDVVARQFVDLGAELAQQRQRLTDAAGRAEDGHLGVGRGSRVKATRGGRDGALGGGAEGRGEHYCGILVSESWFLVNQ
mmetsp:Transcript_4296/g.11969  ORF Transcript_4296/g.11969 Transcript_4296/m.11969 type:complete len:373 (-) Transcript_4296:57-1175(-)